MKEYILKVILWKGGTAIMRFYGQTGHDAYQRLRASNPNVANLIEAKAA